MKNMRLPSFSVTQILCLSAISGNIAYAQTSSLVPYPERETITLSSTAGHGGSHAWKMQKSGDVQDDGSAISKPGFKDNKWMDAIVPGTVLNSLVADGVYPEPYFGVNNQREQKLIPDISETGAAFYTYWFRTTFEVPEAFKGSKVWMQLNGINYKAEIWINGTQIGNMAGMFNRGLFNVTDTVNIGSKNAIAVLVHPIDPPNGFKKPKIKNGKATNENQNGNDGKIGRYTTMLMTSGWDFTLKDGIRDRNTGIWRDITLFSSGPVILRNPFVISKLPLPKLTSSKETITVELINATDKTQKGTLTATVAEQKVTISQSVELAANETRKIKFTPDKFPELNFIEPRLWWPFNKGEQFLHHLDLTFSIDGELSDTLKTRFGIRDIRSDRNTPDKSRMFYVNGKRIFLHGSNWIPEAMLRTSTERTIAELRYTRQAGVNFLRLWAGGITESDEFFDICDEQGIMVWVEFWLTGNTVLPEDPELYRYNVKDTVKRIRNHPSIAYYVSSNERDAKGIVPIKDILDELDPTIGYQPGSELDGVHDGSPYKAVNPMWYYEDTASTRGSRINGLCPEYGTPITPTIDALREMMPEKDFFPLNKATWDYLDGDGFHGMTSFYDSAIKQYGPSSSIEEYLWKGQMFGSLAYKAIWECWNANRFDYGDRFSTGVLFWYNNCPNRQTCSRMWDWSLEPTAALYSSQSAHEPVHIQYDFLKNTVGVNNELPEAFKNLTATIRILNFNMKEVYSNTVKLDLPADCFVKDVIKVELPEKLTPIYFLKLSLTDAADKVLSDNFYWSSNKPYKPGRTLTGPQFQGMEPLSNLPKAEIQSTVLQSSSEGKNYYTVTVENPSKNLAFMVWLRLQDTETGKPIRPAFYDENFFSLLPGESQRVSIEYKGSIAPKSTQLIIDGWNVNRQLYRNGKFSDLADTKRTIKKPSLATDKKTTADTAEADHTPEKATDYDSATRWASARSDNHWLAVDLGEPTKFSSVAIAWEAACATDYEIQVSNDGNNWQTVVHVTNGKGGTVTLKFESVTARHIRMKGNKRATKYGFSIFDFAVYK